MTETLVVKDTIQRNGYTVIDGVRVVQHTCVIDSENPQNMVLKMLKLNVDMYKIHRDTCRNDFAVFEDEAYALQEKLLANKTE
jgi:hypothetical protein